MPDRRFGSTLGGCVGLALALAACGAWSDQAAADERAPASRGARADDSPHDRAIFAAAGFRFVPSRGQWESGACGDPPPGDYQPGAIVLEDVNGDGRPEALVTEGGICYGNIGQRFWMLSQRANGQWTVMIDSIVIAELLATRGVDGFPDVLGGGPGFCFPVVRWNGREYAIHRYEYEGKPCSPPR